MNAMIVTVVPRIREMPGLGRMFMLGCLLAVQLAFVTNLYAMNSDQQYDFNIDEKTLGKAIDALVRKTDVLVLYPYELASSTGVNPVTGRHTISEAFDILLRGTKFSGGLTQSGVLTISLNEQERPQGQEDKMKTQDIRKTWLTSLSALLFGVGSVGSVQAEDVGKILDEIIVTAEKRSASIQDVPISMNAYNAAELRTRGLTSTLDLENKTLGLNLTMLQSNPTITIRGVGNTISGIQSDPTVGIYNDGIYQARPALFRVGFYDLNRVEVLKGPQGTLYGRNTTGGVINVITNDPTDEFGGHVSAGIGSFKLLTTEAAINIPFENGAVRVAGYLIRDDGYTENLASDQRLDSRDTRAFRIKVKFNPTERLTTIFGFESVNDDSLPGSGYLNSRATDPLTGISLTEESEQMYMQFANGTDARHVNLDGDLYSNRDIYQLTAKVTYEGDDFTFKSISGYVDMKITDATDTDGTAAPVEQSISKETSHSLSQEFQLSSNNTDMIDWMGGLYYFKENATSDSYFGFNSVVLGGTELYEDKKLNKANTRSFGIFGNVGFQFTDTLKLTVGARYTHEKKDFLEIDVANSETGELTEVSYNEFTPKAIFEWTPNDDVLAYASITKGFKSGGLSFGRLDIPATPYDPERLWAYEIGAKTTLVDGRVQLNLAAFYYDFKNLQTDVLLQDPVTGLLSTVIGNSPDVKIKGVEVDIKAQITDGLRFDAAFAHTDSKLPDIDFPLPHTPKWRANFGVEYVAVVGSGNVILRGDMTYQSNMLFPGLNSPELEQSPGYTLFDAGVVYERQDQDWTLSMAVKNITNKEVLAIRGDFRPFNILELYAPPRTWELRLTVNY